VIIPESAFNDGQGIMFQLELFQYRELVPGKKRRANEARVKAPARTLYIHEDESMYNTLGLSLQEFGHADWLDDFPYDLEHQLADILPADWFTIQAGSTSAKRPLNEIRTPGEFLDLKYDAMKKSAAKIRLQFYAILRADDDEQPEEHEEAGRVAKRTKVRRG
jgi:hypothetical protein